MKNERLSKFIDFICNKCKNSKADAAKFRRADTDKNNLAVMSTMVAFGIDITKDSEFIPFSLVTAAIARGKKYENGDIEFAKALSLVVKRKVNAEGKTEQDDSRLTRIVACNDLKEISLILRPVLAMIQSRIDNRELNYLNLLDDLCSFAYEEGRQRIKKKWAMQFYSSSIEQNEKEDSEE